MERRYVPRAPLSGLAARRCRTPIAERPTVIRTDPVAGHGREMMFDIIHRDIPNAPADLLGRALEYMTGVGAKDRMPYGSNSARHQRVAPGGLHRADHFLRPEPMPPNQQVRMVPKDRARVARESPRDHRLPERSRQYLPSRVFPPKHGQGEFFLCRLVKRSQFRKRRLDRLAPLVGWSEFRNARNADFVRHAPSRIVGQPVTVTGEDNVVGDGNHLRDNNDLQRRSASCQSRFACAMNTPPGPQMKDYHA